MLQRFKKKVIFSLLIAVILGLPSFALAGDITIAVAANFTNTMNELIENYKSVSPTTNITAVYDASGTFDAEIRNGNTVHGYSLFFSADNIRPRDLVADGFAINKQDYAIGVLAAYSATPGYDMDADWFQGTEFTSGAVANPALAPYGVAAQQYLTSIGLWPDARIKADYANINEAFYAARDGLKQVGFVAYAQVIRITDAHSLYLPPQSTYTPIVQSVCQITANVNAATRTEAAAFYNWVLGNSVATEIIESWSYALP